MKQKLTKLNGEKDSSIIIIGDFNTPFSIIEQLDRRHLKK